MMMLKILIFLIYLLGSLSFLTFLLGTGLFIYGYLNKPKSKKKDFNKNLNKDNQFNPTKIDIDDYNKFVDDCETENVPPEQEKAIDDLVKEMYDGSKDQSEKFHYNPQKERMKEKQILKRRKRSRIAKKSRKANRK